MRPGRSKTALSALLVALTLSSTACGGSSNSSAQHGDVSPPGDIPDTQAFVEFGAPDGSYHVKVPEGWARREMATGTTFTDKLNMIKLVTRAQPSQPTDASVRSSEVPYLENSLPQFHLIRITTVSRRAGHAVLIAYRSLGARDPVTDKRRTLEVDTYEFWQHGTLVEITLSSPKGADNVDPWRTVTDSFAWT